MPQPLHNIDRFIYDELHDLNEDPKTSVWRKLEDQLDQQEEPERKIRFFYTKRVAIVAFLVLWSLTLYELSHHSAKNQQGLSVKIYDTKSDDTDELTNEASNEQQSNLSGDNLVSRPSLSYLDGKNFSVADETAFSSSNGVLDNKTTDTGNASTLSSQTSNTDGRNALLIQPIYPHQISVVANPYFFLMKKSLSSPAQKANGYSRPGWPGNGQTTVWRKTFRTVQHSLPQLMCSKCNQRSGVSHLLPAAYALNEN
jgi:hypothetical protein